MTFATARGGLQSLRKRWVSVGGWRAMVALVIKGDNSRATLTKKNFLD
jgi:hypothetical protein